MDKATEKRLDAVNEDEVRRGYRLKALPKVLQANLAEEGGAALTRVRFTRLNPSRRRKIAEVVQRQYHKDLRDPDILSHEQLVKLVTERGEWSEALTKEMHTLQESVNRRMGILFFAKSSDNVVEELWEKADAYRTLLKEHLTEPALENALTIFSRWVDYTPGVRAFYDETHAPAQNRATYSSDADLQRLYLVTPGLEHRTLLDEIEQLRDKVYDLIVLQRDRVRLNELVNKHAKIFSDSAEQRRDNAEDMARMYFTTERVDEDGKPLGPVADSFEALYDFPEDVIQWLLIESYFFQNGTPDEAREYLETVGFLVADRDLTDKASQSSESAVSAESPVPPSSKDDSAAATMTPAASTDSTADTTSTTPSLP